MVQRDFSQNWNNVKNNGKINNNQILSKVIPNWLLTIPKLINNDKSLYSTKIG